MIAKRQQSDAPIFDLVPPNSTESEMAVLGSILLNGESIGKAAEILQPEHFYRTAHRKIFGAALLLYERNEPVDLVMLAEELKTQKNLEGAGGAYYLTELVQQTASSANIEHYAKIVFEKYLARKLIEESTETSKECYDAGENIYEVMDRAESRIFSLSEKRVQKAYEHIAPIMHEAFDVIEKFHKRQSTVTGLATGFSKLDELTAGLQPSELIIIAGRPSSGKTSLGLNIARNVAIGSNVPVGFFSLEMARRQLALRLLCAESNQDAHRVRTGKLTDEEWQRLGKCAGTITQAPIYIDDTPGITALELRSKARRMRKEHNVGLIVIDYLQLMTGQKAESREREIAMISGHLKGLARELDIPVIALSQLSRAVEARGGDKRPILSDLRESGVLENDADVVLFTYRPEMYGKKTDSSGESLEGKAEIIIGKQRNGPVGTVYLTFLKYCTKFSDPVGF